MVIFRLSAILLVLIENLSAQSAAVESSTARDARIKGSAAGLDKIFQRNWSLSPTSRCKLNWNVKIGKKNVHVFLLVLSLFTVVQWGQSLCQAPSGEYGSCVPNNECSARGGIAGGPCAEGYGLCCVCMRA